MGDEERIDDRVDDGTLAGLVADSPAQVQHEGQVALLRVAGGVLHRVLDTAGHRDAATRVVRDLQDRKSTRLNSSHITISYAVFCLKKKTSTPVSLIIPRNP